MNIEWEKAVRRTLNLPKTTRSKLIPLLAGNRSFQEQHERGWGALYVRMMQSENILVQYMARRSMYNVLGTLGTNMVVLRHKSGVPVPRNNGVFNCLYMTCEEDIHRANMIRELLQVRGMDNLIYLCLNVKCAHYLNMFVLCKCHTIDKEHCGLFIVIFFV